MFIKILLALLFGLGGGHTLVHPIGPAVHGYPIHVQSIYPIGPATPPCFPNCGVHL